MDSENSAMRRSSDYFREVVYINTAEVAYWYAIKQRGEFENLGYFIGLSSLVVFIEPSFSI